MTITDPIIALVEHQPLIELVAAAENEVRRLCLGQGQRGGRRWTMCVPVQADDSDVVLVGALRRQAARIAELEEELRDSQSRRLASGREVERLSATLARRNEQMDELTEAIAPPGNRPGHVRWVDQARGLVATLVELVDLNEIKERAEKFPEGTSDYLAQIQAYRDRQPKAWAAARRLLGREA